MAGNREVFSPVLAKGEQKKLRIQAERAAQKFQERHRRSILDALPTLSLSVRQAALATLSVFRRHNQQLPKEIEVEILNYASDKFPPFPSIDELVAIACDPNAARLGRIIIEERYRELQEMMQFAIAQDRKSGIADSHDKLIELLSTKIVCCMSGMQQGSLQWIFAETPLALLLISASSLQKEGSDSYRPRSPDFFDSLASIIREAYIELGSEKGPAQFRQDFEKHFLYRGDALQDVNDAIKYIDEFVKLLDESSGENIEDIKQSSGLKELLERLQKLELSQLSLRYSGFLTEEYRIFNHLIKIYQDKAESWDKQTLEFFSHTIEDLMGKHVVIAVTDYSERVEKLCKVMTTAQDTILALRDNIFPEVSQKIEPRR
ncbi:MAG TPA: hypothetical protein VNC84_07620 [Gammaproteobacteria bacterium]|jgi:hypothetical protein|nr:hypothetical protein [Gammaproteobacteria bacterium]